MLGDAGHGNALAAAPAGSLVRHSVSAASSCSRLLSVQDCQLIDQNCPDGFETQLITRGPGGLTCPGASLPAELPAELVLLAIYVSAWLITIAVVAAPAWFLRSRAYLLMLTSAGCSLVLMSSLITHPNSEPSQHWIHFLPTAGLGLMWNQLMHRVSVLFSLEGGGIDVTDDSPYGLPGCTQSARSMSFYLFP